MARTDENIKIIDKDLLALLNGEIKEIRKTIEGNIYREFDSRMPSLR